MRVLEKTDDFQVLDADDVVVFDNLGRFLLKEVGPDNCDLLVVVVRIGILYSGTRYNIIA